MICTCSTELYFYFSTDGSDVGFHGLRKAKSHNRTETDFQGVGRDILISKKLFLEPCGQFPVTQLTSGEIVDFRKTRLHPKKNGGQSGAM